MQKKRGFTLIEVLIVIFVFATGVMIVVQGVNKTTAYISEMTQRTIAMNLAKEGIEAMYNIRNTNWRKRSSEKDKCWVKANPAVDEGNDGCENDHRLHAGRWMLRYNKRGQLYLEARTGEPLSPKKLSYRSDVQSTRPLKELRGFMQLLEDGDRKGHDDYLVHYISEKGRVQHKDFLELSEEEKRKEDKSRGIYLHFIAIAGLYPKDAQIGDASVSEQYRGCRSGNSYDQVGKICGDERAKELRFCSVVYYLAPHKGYVNVCSIMTNFQK